MNLKLKAIFKASYILTGCLTMMLGSCRDDSFLYVKDCPEGEEASISLTFNAPEREQYTRSSLSADHDNQVNSLWLGIYNTNSGKCTTNLYIADGEYGFNGNTGTHNDITLKDIPTVSGESRIVVVANPDNHSGRKLGDTSNSDLTTLLENAKTWDDYLKISVEMDESAGETASVQTPLISDTRALVMSGSFVPSDYDNHDPNQTWSNDMLNQTVSIYPGNSTLGGKVHLRRLLSHITFNIVPEGNIVDIEPISWQVNNVPVYSWMHERTNYGNYGQTQSEIINATNAGDAITPEYADNNNYKPSLIHTATDFSKETITGDANGRNRYSFDFWINENKREGLATCDNYQKRELEYGGAIGNLTDPDPTGTGNSNMSGVFVSLTDKNVTLNNKATYVDIPCVVTYIVDTDNDNSGAGTGINIPVGAKRTAQMTYRVHLGYVGGANARPEDFNSYRNSNYTYNIKIRSLKNVVVEAFRQGDNQPGGFGTVTDVTDMYYDLDAHYNVFNIYLTEDELKTFSFSMVSYENGMAHEIHGGLDKGSNIPASTDPNYKYYSWIELLPVPQTSRADELMKYPGVGDTNLLHLGDFIPNADGTASQTAGYYTVFVNEYAYETSSDESQTPAWRGYVNQPNRNVWINVTEHISTDGASTYYQAKYAFSQKSIQSYYSSAGSAGNISALGMEHENENFGMNIRWNVNNNWTVGTTGNAVLDNENGRWNAWIFANNNRGANGKWNNAVDFTKPQIVNDITNANQYLSTIYPERDILGKTLTVPSVSLLTGLNGSQEYNRTATSYDPQKDGDNIQYYQGFYACMNRNRDLNGDGNITADEIRWYLPTSGQMLRLILGRNGLKTPIMSYPNKNLYTGSSEGHNVLFHYLTSDYKIIWTEEGMSSSTFVTTNGDAQYRRAPWEVRCIRNLGTNLGATIQRTNRVAVAYTTEIDDDTKGGVVKPTRYYGSSLRNPSTGPIQIHKTNDPLNRLAQYGFEIAPRGNDFKATTYDTEAAINTFHYEKLGISNKTDNPSTTVFNGYVTAINDSICRSLDSSTGRSGWRVPTQKEIVIMLRTTDSKNTRILGSSNSDHAFFSVTQEYWENTTNTAKPSMTPGTNFRFCTVSGTQAEAKNLLRLYYVRCVRDLTAAEANMSYTQIKAQTRSRTKAKARRR